MNIQSISRRLLSPLEIQRLTWQWRVRSRSSPSGARTRSVPRVLLLPSDPWTLVGSKGDEAMLQAAIGEVRKRSGDASVGIATATEEADSTARGMQFAPVPLWRSPWSLERAFDRISEFDPDVLLVLGADIMDGYYDALTSIRLLTLADLAARRGIKSAVLGFSFNDHPHPRLRGIFDGATPNLVLNVRDGKSLSRFREFSRARARLVADMAFVLAPDSSSPDVAAIQSWVAHQRGGGKVVIGFNVHPMLVKKRGRRGVAALIQASVAALSTLLEEKAVSVVLLSHDYREDAGDDACLSAVYGGLSARFRDRVLHPMQRLSAAQLKATAGCLDGVVTGRMHLAIASLGSGVPVAALTYQDKFQGLFDHFGLPHAFLLAPSDARSPSRLSRLLKSFVEELPALRARVEERLPAVLEASASNLDGIA